MLSSCLTRPSASAPPTFQSTVTVLQSTAKYAAPPRAAQQSACISGALVLTLLLYCPDVLRFWQGAHQCGWHVQQREFVKAAEDYKKLLEVDDRWCKDAFVKQGVLSKKSEFKGRCVP